MSLNNQQNRPVQVSLAASQVASGVPAPFSFKEWIDYYKGVIPGQEFRQYNEYLVEWYNDNSIKTTSALTDLQISYLFLLKQLQVFFQKKDLENWYVNIDISNEKELLLAIPYFAKKLKEISLYYLKLRNTIKDNQIKYKLVGTPEGTNQEVQDLVLTHFTRKPGFIQTIPAEIWANVPELSSITEPINLEIEELYDTFNYMDHSYSMPVSAYYNLSDEATNNFFTSIGLDFKNDTWVFNTGVFNNELSAQIVDNIDLNDRILKKYLGSDKFTISPIITSNNSKIINLSLTEGNNFFYWPAGAYKTSLTNLPFYEPVSLSSTKIESIAKGSDKFSEADTIYIKTTRGIEGAWLRKEFFTEKPATMKCTIRRAGKTQFRFPYPGYGLSGEDLPWTGFGLETNRRFYYLNNEYKEAINNVYWTTNFGLTGSQPITLNSTTLVDSKAYANIDYNLADKIRTWPSPPKYTSSLYGGKINEAWLYQFNQTDISIAEKADSTIAWPFQKINTTSPYPKNIPTNLTNFCGVTPLSTIQFPFSVASNTISSADTIYMIQNYRDGKNRATTCAWLSGREVHYPETKTITVLQPGLTINAQPGEFTKFIWHGTDNIEANTVFVSYKHEPDCRYLLEKGTFSNINLCTCKQVIFTPFGHPGTLFTDNQSLADFIIEDTDFNSRLDLTKWKDRNGINYTQSKSFGWFKTEKEIGWGYGQWVDGTGTPLQLKQGRSYIYYRCDSRNISTEVVPFSSIIVRFSYNNFNSNNFIWIRGNRLPNNTWQTDNKLATIAFNPGDNIIYTRQPTTTYSISGTVLRKQSIAENRGSIWTNIDYATTDQTVILNYPVQVTTLDPIDQYPSVGLSNLLNVFMWSISSQATNKITYFKNVPSVTFNLPTTGLYSFSVTAISAENIPAQTVLPTVFTTTTLVSVVTAANRTATTVTVTAMPVNPLTYTSTATAFYVFNQIPLLTALPTEILIPSLTALNTPVPGFVLNTPLYGWNYSTNQSDPNPFAGNQGARPIWVKSSLVDPASSSVDFPRLDTLGSSLRLVDSHNLISFPEPSDMVLQAGMFVEYERNGNSDINWTQTVTLKVSGEKNIWSKISYNNDSNLKNILKGDTVNAVVIPTSSASTMLLQTYVDNEPVEVYYNSKSPFVWSVTAVPVLLETTYSDITATNTIDVVTPSKNLSNRYYPNIATLPTLQSLSSQSDLGGYFTPSNLGILQYIDKDYTVTAITSSINFRKVYENPKEFISGTGSTKQEQLSPYKVETEDSTWLKEPPIAGPIAGTIKKSVFKQYPKFIPYQSVNETSSLQKLGLITQDSLQTPWTGPEDTDWADPNNRPISFTGQINVKTWADSQLLKRTTLQLENWCTDIYNNQYGLYKPTKNTFLTDKKYIPGELWVRKNSQKVYPASTGLSGVFDTYQNISLINQLTGLGIRHIETFFDTLYIQTSSSVIFEKINYDYDTDEIFSLIDNARFLSLAMPIQTNLDREFNLSGFDVSEIRNTDLQIAILSGVPVSLSSENIQNLSNVPGYIENSWSIISVNTALSTVAISYSFYNGVTKRITSVPGETWFFPTEKIVIQSTCALSGNILIPELYRYNSNSLAIQKIFPLNQNDTTIIQELTALKIQKIEAPLLTYNNNSKQYIMTVNTTDLSGDNIHIDFKINNSVVQLALEDITVYTPVPKTAVQEPPAIPQNLHFTLQFSVPIEKQVTTLNGPATFTSIDWPYWIRISSTGLIEGRAVGPGFYTLPFYATNSFGSTYACLTIFIAEEFINVDRIVSAETSTDFFSLTSILTQLSGALITN